MRDGNSKNSKVFHFLLLENNFSSCKERNVFVSGFLSLFLIIGCC
jgi:hypothetical protein